MKPMRVAYLGLLAALACSGEGEDGDDTELQQLWLETAPQQYVAQSCSTGFTVPTCTVSAVDGGEPVASMEWVMDEGDWRDVTPAIDVVQGMLNGATSDEPEGCQRRVTQHEQYAFPSLVYSDCGGEGWGRRVTCFAADTLELSRCQ